MKLFLYLSMKQGRWFRFVLSYWDLQNHHISCHTLHIFRKLLMNGCIDLVWNCLELWCGSYWLLNKIETENSIEIWGCSWCCWKALSKSDIKEFISQFWELICGRYWFWSGFCCYKSKQFAKNRVWKEKSVEPSMCVHTWANGTGYTSVKYVCKMKTYDCRYLQVWTTGVEVDGCGWLVGSKG